MAKTDAAFWLRRLSCWTYHVHVCSCLDVDIPLIETYYHPFACAIGEAVRLLPLKRKS